MDRETYPILTGEMVFRKNELVYVNKSSEDFSEYMEFMHSHDFIEIVYVISGKGRHMVGDNQYEISHGDLFVINHDVPHGFFPKEKNINEPVVYNCVFMPNFLDSSLFNSSQFQDIASSFLFRSLFPDNNNPLPDINFHGTDFYEIGDLFNKMYVEYKMARKGYCDIIRAYLIELIVKMFRYMESGVRKETSNKNQELVKKAIAYMKQNYNAEIKLEDVAMKSFLSKNYFCRLFKEVTGINFSDYIQKIRIDEACNLLKSTDMKVSDIAFHTGFNDLKFFYDVFKRIIGEKPGDYRKTNRVL